MGRRKLRVRQTKVNGFNVRLGRRSPRRVRDYKNRKGKSYKTKTGQIWRSGRYFRKGIYKSKSSGFIRY